LGELEEEENQRWVGMGHKAGWVRLAAGLVRLEQAVEGGIFKEKEDARGFGPNSKKGKILAVGLEIRIDFKDWILNQRVLNISKLNFELNSKYRKFK
jgi:hypothetical protein